MGDADGGGTVGNVEGEGDGCGLAVGVPVGLGLEVGAGGVEGAGVASWPRKPLRMPFGQDALRVFAICNVSALTT